MNDEEFEVQGAGTFRIGKNSRAWCGDAIGFHIACSWGKHGFAGGVMDREEARRLADHIHAALEADAELPPVSVDDLRAKLLASS